MMIHPLKIGDCTIPGNIFLAPMAGYTDAPFRSVCFELGAYFCFTEMVSAEACYRKNEKTLKLLVRAENEPYYGTQIFGSDPFTAEQAVKEIQSFSPTVIDLNCGCSIPKIMKPGAGAALLQSPDKIAEILKAMKGASDIPISVKIRLGWDANSINYLEIAEKAMKAGISLITLHPRTRAQVFSGTAQWEHLKKLKELCNEVIPVIGSGDLFTAEDVRRMLDETGCDGVMLARGAIGNPYIFRDVEELLNKGISPPPATAEEVLRTGLKQLKMAIQFKGPKRASTEMRKQFCSYTKGLSNSAKLRQALVQASSYEEYENLIESFLRGEL